MSLFGEVAGGYLFAKSSWATSADLAAWHSKQVINNDRQVSQGGSMDLD